MADCLICADIFELAGRIPAGQRLLGLDVGDKTVGLAIADPGMTVASPLWTLERKKLAPIVDAIAELARTEQVGGLVAGLPVSMDGSLGPQAQAVQDFTTELAGRLGLPAAFWDERLSTSAVERVLISEADMNRKRRKQVVDKMAAAYILQGAIDAVSIRRRMPPA